MHINKIVVFPLIASQSDTRGFKVSCSVYPIIMLSYLLFPHCGMGKGLLLLLLKRDFSETKLW